MKQNQPTTPDEWLDEIRLAIADARETGPFGDLIGQPITDANLFHLAPLVCLKFRGLDHRDEELRKKVTKPNKSLFSSPGQSIQVTVASGTSHPLRRQRQQKESTDGEGSTKP